MAKNNLFKIGLKLYSTNTGLIGEALTLKDEFFDYVELYIIPGSFNDTIRAWKKFEVPYVVHAPHSFHGVNLARAELREKNISHMREVQLFANELNADVIIVHSGNNGSINETIEQLRIINDSRIVVENKPKIGIFNENCIGWSPSEFLKFKEVGVLNGFALDFTHAIYAARASGNDEWKFIQLFVELEPKIFHISDIDSSSHKDMHLNLGRGSLNLKQILSFIPVGGLLTVETPRVNAENLSEFVTDIKYLRTFSSGIS